MMVSLDELVSTVIEDSKANEANQEFEDHSVTVGNEVVMVVQDHKVAKDQWVKLVRLDSKELLDRLDLVAFMDQLGQKDKKVTKELKELKAVLDKKAFVVNVVHLASTARWAIAGQKENSACAAIAALR